MKLLVDMNLSPRWASFSASLAATGGPRVVNPVAIGVERNVVAHCTLRIGQHVRMTHGGDVQLESFEALAAYQFLASGT